MSSLFLQYGKPIFHVTCIVVTECGFHRESCNQWCSKMEPRLSPVIVLSPVTVASPPFENMQQPRQDLIPRST